MVDPQLDIDTYIQAAERLGMKIRYVIDTHLHADHISGGRALAEATGAQYVLHASAGAQYGFLGVQDGDLIDMGNVVARVIHTPGHTPEHISLVVTDRSRGPEPWFVLTGHTLMAGDLGRTELAVDAAAGAADLYTSAQKLLELPDYLEVYPGAFSGSVCGRSLSGKPASTIGFERMFNRALRLGSKEEFISFMLQEIPPRPERADETRAVNMGRQEKVEA